MEKPVSLCTVVEKAWKTPAKARPTSTVTGQASSTPTQDSNTPKGAITSRKTPQVVATRNSTNSSWAATMSATARGLAVIA
jgi:hypothetical protein